MSHRIDPILLKQHNSERHKRWAAKNRPKIRANYRRWYHGHIEQVHAESREKYNNRSERVTRLERNSHYRRRYGITLEQYEQILISQNGVCAICGSDRAGKTGQCFAVDHCHKTGKVRGLLCIRCNMYLGWFEDQKSWHQSHLQKIEEYLSQ